MNERSEAHYNWISDRTDQLDEWLEAHVSKPFADNIARILIIALFIMIALAGLSLLEVPDSELDGLSLILKNIGPEMAGIVIGVVTIDYLNERRQREQLKQQLIRQMGLNIRDVAVAAVRELRHHGWLRDGSLNGVNLMKADLREAELFLANLSGAVLIAADLREANLKEADLHGAYLWGVNLSGALLYEANLRGATVIKTNLDGAYLRNANLSSIKSWNIRQLEQAEVLDGAIMPDGIQLVGGEDILIVQNEKRPTFKDWKLQYLEKHGGSENDMRDIFFLTLFDDRE